MSVSDALQLMISFGMFILALITLVVVLIKNSTKNDHLSFAQLMVIKLIY
ncbi:putative holin-like toxin [Leuconostoc citreum]